MPENSLVKVVFHFEDGKTIQLHLQKPVPQKDAMISLAGLANALGVEDVVDVFGFGMDKPGERWEKLTR